MTLARCGQGGGVLGHEPDHRGRGHCGIAAAVHRRGAGMVGAAIEQNLDPGDAGDRLDHADGDLVLLQDDALLDMQLEKGGDVASGGGVQFGDGAAHAFDGRGQTLAPGCRIIQMRGCQPAGHGAAADAGEAEVARLLGQEIDQLDGVAMGLAAFLQHAQHLQPGQHAGDAVEASAVRDGVGVRAQHDRRRGRVGPPAASDQVAAAVDPARQPRRLETLAQPGPSFQEQRGKGAARERPARLGELGERHDIRPQALLVDTQGVRAHAGGRTNWPPPGAARTSCPS